MTCSDSQILMSGLAAMSPDEAARSAIAQARALNHVRKHEEAITVLTRALGRDPANPLLTRELAYSLQWTDNHDAALKVSKRAIALDPANEWAHLLHSSALQSVGRDREALASARDAARLAPHSYDAHYRIFECQLSLGEVAGAWSLARLLELGPNDLRSHRAAGEVAMLEERWPQAEAAFRRALAIDPGDPNTLALLGTVLGPRKQGDGLELIKSAIRINPRSRFVGGLLTDEVERRLRPLAVMCTLVVMAGLLGALLVVDRNPGLAILIGLVSIGGGPFVIPWFLSRGRLSMSVEAYVFESSLRRRGTLLFLGFFFAALACFSAPMLVLSLIVDNQSPGFRVLVMVTFIGFFYLIGRLWQAKVERWLSSRGLL